MGTRAGPRLACFWRDAIVLNVRRVGAREEKGTCSLFALPGEKKQNKRREAHMQRTVMYVWTFPRSLNGARTTSLEDTASPLPLFRPTSHRKFILIASVLHRSASQHFTSECSSSKKKINDEHRACGLARGRSPTLLTVGDFQVLLCVWSTFKRFLFTLVLV